MFDIVMKPVRKTKRHGEQASRFRREIKARGIGPANDPGEIVERRCCKAELIDHRIKGAGLATMAPEHAFNVKGRRIEAFRNAADLFR